MSHGNIITIIDTKHPSTFTQTHTLAQLKNEPQDQQTNHPWLFSLHLLSRLCFHSGAPTEPQCFPKPCSKVHEILINVLCGGREKFYNQICHFAEDKCGSQTCKTGKNHLGLVRPRPSVQQPHLTVIFVLLSLSIVAL